MEALKAEAEPVRERPAPPPQAELLAEVAVLDLPERVKERLRELIATGPPTDEVLTQLYGDLSGNDEATRAGMCWYLGRAELTSRQRPAAKRALEAVVGEYLPYGLPSWRQVLPVALYVAGVIAVLPPLARWGFLSLAAAGAVGPVRRLREHWTHRQRPGALPTPVAVWALRALESVSGQLPVDSAAQLVAEGPGWLQPHVRAEFAAVAGRVPSEGADPPGAGDALRLLGLAASSDAEVAIASLRVLAAGGAGWLAHALPRGAPERLESAAPVELEDLAGAIAHAEDVLHARLARDRREIADEWLAAQTSPQHKEVGSASALAELAAPAVTRLRIARRWLAFGSVGGVVIAMAGLVLGLTMMLHPPYSLLHLVWPVLQVSIGIGAAGALAAIAGVFVQPGKRSPVRLLVATLSPGDAGLVTETTKLMLPDVRRDAEVALVDLLPRVRAAHRADFTPYQRQALLDLLVGSRAVGGGRPLGALRAMWRAAAAPFHSISERGYTHPRGGQAPGRADLAVAILQALMHIGDAGDLTAVRLTERRTRGKAPLAVVHAAAVECLTILAERARKDGDADRLLRPSQAPDDDMLLRPATGAPRDDEGTLVRPAERPDVPAAG